MATSYSTETQLIRARALLAELYNTQSLPLSTKIKILETLGNVDEKAIGTLLAGNATLSPDGVIIYNVVVAEGEYSR